MSNDKNIIPEISRPENAAVPVSLKVWHRPVISRIEIAQTLLGVTASGDIDNGLAAS
jgi:hypothetical protein